MVAVVYGGFSSEAEISVQSGKSVASWLRDAGYEVCEVLLEKDCWKAVTPYGDFPVDKNDFSFTAGGVKTVFDNVFIMIHGNPGENGILQAYFELLGIPYTGCRSLCAAIAFDKYACKCFLRDSGVSLADDIFLRKGDRYSPDGIIGRLGLPVFVKPTNGGSSFGTTKVKDACDIEEAIASAFAEGDTVIIEKAVSGREIDCSVYCDGNGVHALPLTEIIPENEFFDYEAKYLGKSREICPAEMDGELAGRISDTAIKIYNRLGCSGLVRMDFIVTGNGEIYFLELNPNPGMTSESIVPKMVRAAGMEMKDFLKSVMEARK